MADLGKYPGKVAPPPSKAPFPLEVNEKHFLAACVGNIDEDRTLDVWTISGDERKGPGGETIPAGQPFNDVNDTEL
jgi:hypothetical protein